MEPGHAFPEEELTRVLAWLEQIWVDDRLMIIMAAARLDDVLKELLQASMQHQGGGRDSLFGPDRPLGSFSTRILLAYRLGLIDRDYEKYLQAIRKVRNIAAHASEHIDLSSAPLTDHIENLRSIASKSSLWGQIPDAPTDSRSDPGRALFRSIVIAVTGLEYATLCAKEIKANFVCRFDEPDEPGQSQQEEKS